MSGRSTVGGKSAIVGIGTTEFARQIGRPEEVTALEAIRSALEDAGLNPKDVDGVFQVEGQTGEPWDVAHRLGVENLRAFSTTGGGGGAAAGPVVWAATAVAGGLCEVAVAYRARNRGSMQRPWAQSPARPTDRRAFDLPYGLVAPAQQIALTARRYLYESGAPEDCFARVAVAQRDHATRNPRAVFRDPITVEDVLESRMISDPLHLLECCPETDGACAVVVTSVERARDLAQAPAVIAGVAQGTGHRHTLMTNLQAPDPLVWPGASAAQDLYAMAGLTPGDVDVALLYDMFTPVTLYNLESYGFCGRGEAGHFVAEGGIDGVDAKLPVNTHGGNMSEGFLHGFNHVLEGVRQIRGSSTGQVANVDVALVGAAPVVPTSSFLLTR
ncbi:lipid-transfer protein [Myxococcota bacterium]|nr:lipid-transfer protein [Myxococcota bacterium]